MDHHLVVPQNLERADCRYPRFREEGRRIASFARGPPYVRSLIWRAQQGYFFHADLLASLCFECGIQYPQHAETCPLSDYNLQTEIPPSATNAAHGSDDADDAQEMNINLRPLRGTEPPIAYADFNVRRRSFHVQGVRTWTQHLANAGFYASKSFTQHTVVQQLSFLFSFSFVLLLLSFSRFVCHIFMKASIC